MRGSVVPGSGAAMLLALLALLPASGVRGQEEAPKPQATAVLANALAQAKQSERLVFLHSGADW